MTTEISASTQASAAPDAASLLYRIPQVDALFSQYPQTQFLIAITYPRQETVREVHRSGDRLNWIGWFASRINQKQIPFESALEHKAFLIFESHPEIQAYRAQSCELTLQIRGIQRTVYPDVELRTTTREALVEIKPASKAKQQKFRERFAATRAYCEARGQMFSLMTETEILGQRLVNATWLLSLARGSPDPRLVEAVWDWLGTCPAATYGEVFDLASAYPVVQCVLSGLVLDGHIALDLESDLRGQPVTLNQGGR